MPYKAVCEELWSIWSDALRPLRYRENAGKQWFALPGWCRSRPKPAGRTAYEIRTRTLLCAAKRGHTWGLALTCQQGFRCRFATFGIYALRLADITAPDGPPGRG